MGLANRLVHVRWGPPVGVRGLYRAWLKQARLFAAQWSDAYLYATHAHLAHITVTTLCDAWRHAAPSDAPVLAESELAGDVQYQWRRCVRRLTQLAQANAGWPHAVHRALEQSYARRGKARHDILRDVLPPHPSPAVGDDARYPKRLRLPHIPPLLHTVLLSDASYRSGAPRPDTFVTPPKLALARDSARRLPGKRVGRRRVANAHWRWVTSHIHRLRAPMGVSVRAPADAPEHLHAFARDWSERTSRVLRRAEDAARPHAASVPRRVAHAQRTRAEGGDSSGRTAARPTSTASYLRSARELARGPLGMPALPGRWGRKRDGWASAPTDYTQRHRARRRAWGKLLTATPQLDVHASEKALERMAAHARGLEQRVMVRKRHGRMRPWHAVREGVDVVSQVLNPVYEKGDAGAEVSVRIRDAAGGNARSVRIHETGKLSHRMPGPPGFIRVPPPPRPSATSLREDAAAAIAAAHAPATDDPLCVDTPPAASLRHADVPPLGFVPQRAMDLRQTLRVYQQLAKSRLTFLVMLSGMMGYALCPASLVVPTGVPPVVSLLALGTGITLCSTSANTLNQIVEAPYDAQMARTRARPLPRRVMLPAHALGVAAVGAVGGVGVLAAFNNPLTAALGALNIVLYAFVYTPMKRLSIANTWIGALVGALPPLMGWASCTGTLAQPENAPAWVLAGILFAWQFPHFNALAHATGNDYARGGYRMMAVTDPALNERVAFRYALLLIPLCSVALPLTHVVLPLPYALLSLVPNALFAYFAGRFWWAPTEATARRCFWFSLIHLPVVMLLAMGCKEELWGSVLGGEGGGVGGTGGEGSVRRAEGEGVQEPTAERTGR
ncbi:heme o synthase [Malassezia sp. CBS 17886]|nr:heme o synthase [Malassezia sp. CBS 17886]